MRSPKERVEHNIRQAIKHLRLAGEVNYIATRAEQENIRKAIHNEVDEAIIKLAQNTKLNFKL